MGLRPITHSFNSSFRQPNAWAAFILLLNSWISGQRPSSLSLLSLLTAMWADKEKERREVEFLNCFSSLFIPFVFCLRSLFVGGAPAAGSGHNPPTKKKTKTNFILNTKRAALFAKTKQINSFLPIRKRRKGWLVCFAERQPINKPTNSTYVPLVVFYDWLVLL